MAVLNLTRILTGLLLSTVALLSTAPSKGSCKQKTYNYGVHTEERMARYRAGRTARTGPALDVTKRVQGNLVSRLEIRDLQQDHDVWMLYILALEQMQLTDQTIETSWYGITGIHGVPYRTWHDVGPVPGSEKTGYCAHSSVLFPTWHRPYLALYEQVLTNLMEDIIQWWPAGPERQRLEAAVQRFRIPYWDWASTPPPGQSILPLSIAGQARIWVDGPNGVQSIDNPLYSYTFKPLDVTAFGAPPWDVWTETYRSPTTNDTRARSDNYQVAVGMDMAANSLRTRLYNLFASYNNYTEFSNNGWKPGQSASSFDSLEGLHDTVHTLAGGGGAGAPNPQGGHMAFIPYSAFDPLFFLHHCNVDRIFALWQSIYTNTWVTPQPAVLASYTTRSGEIVNSTTALTPFFVDSARGAFWTSDGVRDHTTFGYTYPELIGDSLGGTISGAFRRGRGRVGVRTPAAQVKRELNRLYVQSTPAGLFIQEMRWRKQAESGAARPEDKTEGIPRRYPSSLFSEHDARPRKGVVFTGNQYREWIINVYTEKQLLDGSFTIHFFLGSDDSIPSDPRQWAYADNHVGTMGVFAAPTMTMPVSANAQGSSDLHSRASHNIDISGTVPLTSKLVELVISGELDSLSPVDVRVYLEKNLKKRVVAVTGRVVDHEDLVRLGRFGINVVSAPVRVPYDDDELPVWGKVDYEFELK